MSIFITLLKHISTILAYTRAYCNIWLHACIYCYVAQIDTFVRIMTFLTITAQLHKKNRRECKIRFARRSHETLNIVQVVALPVTALHNSYPL